MIRLSSRLTALCAERTQARGAWACRPHLVEARHQRLPTAEPWPARWLSPQRTARDKFFECLSARDYEVTKRHKTHLRPKPKTSELGSSNICPLRLFRLSFIPSTFDRKRSGWKTSASGKKRSSLSMFLEFLISAVKGVIGRRRAGTRCSASHKLPSVCKNHIITHPTHIRHSHNLPFSI